MNIIGRKNIVVFAVEIKNGVTHFMLSAELQDSLPRKRVQSCALSHTSSSSLSLGFSSEVCLTKSGMRISSVARAVGIKLLQ